MIVPMPRAVGGSEDKLLPLIDVVFLLLIFFMLAGVPSVTAPFEIDPPAAGSAAATAAPHGGIAIAADGRVAFAGQTIAPNTVTEHARRWRERHGFDDGVPPLAVRADADAPTGRLLETIHALRRAGIERIRLLAVGRARED